LTNLVLESEILNNVLENKSITRQEIIDIYEKSKRDTNDLFLAAQNLRIKIKKIQLHFQKKHFSILLIYVKIHVHTVHTKQNQKKKKYH
jgi:hypothetical protein